MKQLTVRSAALRLLIYVGIALGFLAIIGIFIVIAGYAGLRELPSAKWFGLPIYTPIVFWYAARQYRHFWRRPSFWITLSGLLVLHLLAFIIILRSYDVRPIWFLVITGVEVAFISIVLDMVLPNSHNRNSRHHAPQDH